MRVRENAPLKEITTFRVGGNARFLTVVETIDELKEAVDFAKKSDLNFFVIGGGSNLLVSDKGFDGVVIKNEMKGISIKESDDIIEVTAGAGEVWDDFVEMCVEKEFGGAENLSAIPGTVGAAPVQNIGAYGVEVKDIISKVVVLDTDTNELKNFTNADCQFSYRSSFFKTPPGKKYIITSVTFIFKREYSPCISYKDIKEYIEKNTITSLTPRALRDATIAIRAAKLPSVTEYGTAGSFFKNPVISLSHYEALKKQYPLMPCFLLPHDKEHVKVPLAWILDNICGFKGFKIGNVGVYKNQALVLVNFGNATSEEVAHLAQMMSDKVKETTDIIIQPEVEYVGY